MGCDIHLYVERRESGAWVSADKWTPDKYDDAGALTVEYDDSFYNGRNYDLFAILADVRNGRGFAGCDTGDGFSPIVAPRGLPEDVCGQVSSESEKWGADGHSHSHVTVAELLSYDWTRRTKKRGWVDVFQWARWRDYGKPREWSGMVSGGMVAHVTAGAMEKAWIELRDERGYPKDRCASAYIRPDEADGKKDTEALMVKVCGVAHRPFCDVEWEEPYYEAAKDFLSTTMPRLWALGDADDVRLCFWFDN